MYYKVGTRSSKLAVRQTESVVKALKTAFPQDEFEIIKIETTGDKNPTDAIDKIGSKGVFVDTIEEALLKGEISLAVHSMKDMPDKPREGLVFTKPLKREDPRDVLILREAKGLKELKPGARIATGSKRRMYQLLKIRPDLEIVPIRGNVDTRIRKLYEADSNGNMLDGIVLAAAGLKRLGREDEITGYLSVDEMIPAPAQGILALEVKEDNLPLIQKINSLHDEYTESSLYLERGFLKKVGATCHDPVGAYAYQDKDEWVLRAIFGNPDGTELKTVCVKGNDMDRLIELAVDVIKSRQ